MAEPVGFEPTVGSTPTQLFESCTFGRSDTVPSSIVVHLSKSLSRTARSSHRTSTTARYGGTVEWLIAGIALVIISFAVTLWWRYLMRRRSHWYTELTNRIPVHSDWWKKHREREGELLYVAIGDSAAQGIGASAPHRSYVGFVAQALRAASERSIRVVNLGISGATIRIAIEQQLPKLAKLKPDIVTVSIGANDMASFNALRFERDIRELFSALPEGSIVADLPTFYFMPAEKRVRVANGILRDAASANNLEVAPLYARMRRQGLWGPMTQFAGDLFHPNDRGYRVWASAFIPLATRRLLQLSGRNA